MAVLMETAPMARSGRPVTKLELSDSERAELRARLAVRKAPADQTVSKWCRRYEAYRCAGLSDAPRPGRPRTVLDEQVQAVVD
jgi:hypothetical protein